MKRQQFWLIFFLIFLLSLTASMGRAADEPAPDESRGDPVKAIQKRVQALEDELDYYKKELEAREALMPTEKDVEERERTEDVLRTSEEESAKYVLLKERTIEARYSLSYDHSSYDKINVTALDIETESYYNMVNTIGVSYGLLPVLSLSASVPFVFKYQKTGDSIEETTIGDISLGVSYQLMEEGGYIPSTVLSLGYSAPTGKSPYKIDLDSELSTGSGTHSFDFGLNFSKVIDPVITFGGIGFSYGIPVTGLSQKRSGAVLQEVKPGYSIGYSMGLGFSLSYNTSITFRFSATHASATRYTISNVDYDSDESSSASFVIGTGWRISPKTSLNVALGYGLVGIEDYSLYFSVPFDFPL